MAEAKTQTEPSMEEILASIRRIIAEDGEAKPQEKAALPDDILELTEIVDEAAPAAEPAVPPLVAPSPAVHGADRPADRLVSDTTATVSIAALAELAAVSGRDQRKDSSMPLGNGQITIEALVRDLLRPMLREWLDANLPRLVERLVREEITRMVRDAQR